MDVGSPWVSYRGAIAGPFPQGPGWRQSSAAARQRQRRRPAARPISGRAATVPRAAGAPRDRSVRYATLRRPLRPRLGQATLRADAMRAAAPQPPDRGCYQRVDLRASGVRRSRKRYHAIADAPSGNRHGMDGERAGAPSSCDEAGTRPSAWQRPGRHRTSPGPASTFRAPPASSAAGNVPRHCLACVQELLLGRTFAHPRLSNFTGEKAPNGTTTSACSSTYAGSPRS